MRNVAGFVVERVKTDIVFFKKILVNRIRTRRTVHVRHNAYFFLRAGVSYYRKYFFLLIFFVCAGNCPVKKLVVRGKRFFFYIFLFFVN